MPAIVDPTTWSRPDKDFFGDASVAVDGNNRRVFDSTSSSLYTATERPMNDQELLEWRQYQLTKTIDAMERREQANESIHKADVTSYKIAHKLLGSPFPVIEHSPSYSDIINGIRWYEHAACLVYGGVFTYWASSRQLYKARYYPSSFRFIMGGFVTASCYTLAANRSVYRLMGMAPNEYECMKYGVVETPDRLKQKAERWAKYAAFREEWMKRYNYNVYGQRPGEHRNLFAACHVPHSSIAYNVKTDYPWRKNPITVSEVPLANDDRLPTNRLRQNVFGDLNGSLVGPRADAMPEINYRRGSVNDALPPTSAIMRAPEPSA